LPKDFFFLMEAVLRIARQMNSKGSSTQDQTRRAPAPRQPRGQQQNRWPEIFSTGYDRRSPEIGRKLVEQNP